MSDDNNNKPSLSSFAGVTRGISSRGAMFRGAGFFSHDKDPVSLGIGSKANAGSRLGGLLGGLFYRATGSRYAVLGAVTVIAVVAIIFRLFELQIVNGAQYAAPVTSAGSVRKIVEPAPRGGIFDRNGVPIAVDDTVYAVHLVNSGQDPSDLNASLLLISNILERNSDTWEKPPDALENRIIFDGGIYPPGEVVGMSFKDGDRDGAIAWAKSSFGMADAEINEYGTDANTLFAYIISDYYYSVDPSYSLSDAYRIATLRYLITMAKGAFEQGQSVKIASGVSDMTIAELMENRLAIGGVDIETEPFRRYINSDSVAHVLGYVGAISANQYDDLKDDGYGESDIIGQTGVEAQNEAYLRGRNGEKRVDAGGGGGGGGSGGVSAVEIAGKPALPGSDVTLTIDMDLQKTAYESLERNIGFIRAGENNGYFKTDSEKNLLDADAGSAVAVDVRSGEVILMANYPTYSPEVFLASSDDAASQAIKAALLNDEKKSLLNRAIQGTYAPGSTFKPLTAIAALEENVIGKNTVIYDAARINIGGRDLFCLEGGHGSLTLKTALETSCNVFFYDIGTDTTIANLHKWAELFGLGVVTGIDLPYERAGRMSSQEFKYETFGDIWRPADTAQVSIGQLYNSFTPLQMACYMSALANGGEYFKPFVTKKVTRYDGSSVRETIPESRRIPIDIEHIDAVKEGMVASTTEIDGTSSQAFADFPITVAGKTGTAETGLESKQSSNAVFVCYAPADDPQIALAVVIEKGVWGSYAAPVARDILEAYFGLAKRASEDDSASPSDSGLVR